MTDTVSTAATTESVEEFALRAGPGWPRTCRRSIRTIPVLGARRSRILGARKGTAEATPRRRIRRYLLPREYGGLGLDYAYQKAFNDECVSYEMPLILNTPSFTICGATILDMGSEDQKRERISAAIRGDEVLCQLLSEPSGGSDLAG